MTRIPSRIVILGVGDFLLGLAYLAGSPARTSSRAYAVLKTWAPVHTWGLLLLLIGAVLLLSVLLRPYVTPRLAQLVTSITAGLGATWCAAWASQLLVTAHLDQHVSYAGAILWTCFGVIPHLILTFGREG